MSARLLLASWAAALIAAAAPAHAVTVDFTLSGTDYSYPGGPAAFTVDGTLSGLAFSGSTPIDDVTAVITSVSPVGERHNVVGASGTGLYDWIFVNTVNGNVATITAFGNFGEQFYVPLSDGSSLYLWDDSTNLSELSINGGDNLVPLTPVTYSAVPAPSAIAVMVPALVGLVLARRRRAVASDLPHVSSPQ